MDRSLLRPGPHCAGSSGCRKRPREAWSFEISRVRREWRCPLPGARDIPRPAFEREGNDALENAANVAATAIPAIPHDVLAGGLMVTDKVALDSLAERVGTKAGASRAT